MKNILTYEHFSFHNVWIDIYYTVTYKKMEISIIILINIFTIFTFNCLVNNVLILSIFWLISLYIIAIIILFLLNVSLIASILLIVYVGAIAILFLFSIMMINFIKIENNILNQYNVIIIFLLSLLLILKFNNLTSLNEIIDKYDTNNLSIINHISI